MGNQASYNCVEVTHFPDAEDIWDCKNVGTATQDKSLLLDYEMTCGMVVSRTD